MREVYGSLNILTRSSVCSHSVTCKQVGSEECYALVHILVAYHTMCEVTLFSYMAHSHLLPIKPDYNRIKC